MVSDQPSAQDESRLDGLGLKALEIMQQIVRLKLKLQDCMKTGSINLAKSRYIMGNRNVSTSQLPTEDSMPFNALQKVECSSSKENGIETRTLTLVTKEPQKKQKSDMDNELKYSINESSSFSDPLHWFGVLVPQNLRVAQDSFKQAIELSIQVANLQAHLEALRVEFCILKLELMKLT